MNINILLIMFFLHIVDDYYLQAQGVLASLKQKSWWEKNAPDKKYRFDYLVALFMHSFSWTFMIMLPIVLSSNIPIWLFVINVLIHGTVDHLKANLKKINLVTDQLIHVLQIVLTWLICFIF